MTSPLEGVWELISDTEEGIAIFTDKHYTYIFQNKNRSTYPEDSSDDAAELEAYRTHQSQGGTYEVSGSSLTLGRDYCRHPGRSGHTLDAEVKFEGDTFTFRGAGLNGLLMRFEKKGPAKPPAPMNNFIDSL